MALVDLNHIQFYQPPTKASLPREKIPKASNANVPAVVREGKPSKVPGPSNGWGQRPWCDDAIEFIDMTDSPPREHLSPSREPLPDLQERSFFDEGSLTGLVTANGHCNTSGLDHIISGDPNDFLTLEELLLGSGETRKSRRADLGREHKEGLSEHTTKEGCGGITTPGSTRGGRRDEPTVLDDDRSEGGDVGFVGREARGGGDSSGYNSDGSTAGGQDEDSNTPDTQPTSVSSSGDGCLPLREMNVHSTSNTPPPYFKDLLLSTPGKQVCGSHDGEHIDTGPGPSAGEDREDQWDPNEAEAEAGHEEDKQEETEGNDGMDDGDTPLLLRSTKKRPLSSAKEKRRVKRRVKRRRFSSPILSDEDTATGDESDISSYTSSRPHRPSRHQPTSSDSTGFEGDTCDDGKMEAVGERSRMAVIYEQQSWEGEIVDERDMKQGRGRPRKQYLVRWKSSWVDGGRLTAPGLVENWKEKKASRCRR